MKKKFPLILLFVFTIYNMLLAQRPALKVGDNPTTINSSAIADFESTTKGFLPPRMTTTERDAIANPAKGLMVYNTTIDCVQVNKGTSAAPTWECLGASSVPSVAVDCNASGFTGTYVAGVALSGATFTVTVTNNSFSTVALTNQVTDLVFSGVTGVTVASVTPATLTLNSAQTGTITYTLSSTSTPASCGTLTGKWSKLTLSCEKSVTVIPNVNCVTATWTAAVTPSATTGLTNGTTYSGTYSIPYTGGTCTLTPDSIIVSGLKFKFAGGVVGVSGNLVYTLSGTYTGATGGTVTFTTRYGCSVIVGVLPTSCLAIKTNNPAATDGVYSIDPDGAGSAFGSISAYCDMTTDGGGWTLIGIFNAMPAVSPTVTSFTSQNTLGVYSRAVVIALANVSSIVQLRSGNSSTSYAHKVTSSANGLAIQALRNSSTATAGAGTWHNGGWATFTVNSGNWDWSVGGAVSPVFNGWPNMYHSSGNSGSVHWSGGAGGGGRTSTGDTWGATYIK